MWRSLWFQALPPVSDPCCSLCLHASVVGSVFPITRDVGDLDCTGALACVRQCCSPRLRGELLFFPIPAIFGNIGDDGNFLHPCPLCRPIFTQGHPSPGPPTRAVFAWWGGRHPRIGRGPQADSGDYVAMSAITTIGALCAPTHPAISSSLLQTKHFISIDPWASLARRLGDPCETLGSPKGHPIPDPIPIPG